MYYELVLYKYNIRTSYYLRTSLYRLVVATRRRLVDEARVDAN